MKAEKIIHHLQELQKGKRNGLVQVDFLFSVVSGGTAITQPSTRPNIILGKYDAERDEPAEFYKPYSRIFNANIITNE